MRKYKFKTLNNWVCKMVLDSLVKSDLRSAFYILFNCHDDFETEVFHKIFKIVVSWFDYDFGFLLSFADKHCSCEVSCFVHSTINKLFYEKN